MNEEKKFCSGKSLQLPLQKAIFKGISRQKRLEVTILSNVLSLAHHATFNRHFEVSREIPLNLISRNHKIPCLNLGNLRINYFKENSV